MKKSEWIILLAVVLAAIALYAAQHRGDPASKDVRDLTTGADVAEGRSLQQEPARQQEAVSNPAIQTDDSPEAHSARQQVAAINNKPRAPQRAAEEDRSRPLQPLTPEQKGAAVFSYISKLKRNDANTNMLKDYVANHPDTPQWSDPMRNYLNGLLQEKSAERFAQGLYHIECGGGLCIVVGEEDPGSSITGTLNARLARDGRSLGVAGWRLWRTEDGGWLGMYASPNFQLPDEPGK